MQPEQQEIRALRALWVLQAYKECKVLLVLSALLGHREMLALREQQEFRALQE